MFNKEIKISLSEMIFKDRQDSYDFKLYTVVA